MPIGRQDDLAVRAADARRELGEHRRRGLRPGEAGLGGVRAVVQADAEHLPRRRRWRAEGVRRVRLGVGQRRRGRPVDEPGPPLAEVGGAGIEPATAGLMDVDGSGADN
jgi:hypothetical protein